MSQYPSLSLSSWVSRVSKSPHNNVLVLHVAKQLDLTQSPAPTALNIVCIHPYNQPRDIYRLKTYTSNGGQFMLKD